MPDDSAELRRSLEAATKQLAEKDAHLREVHHRIKNNLQLIMSLMGIRARDVESPEVKRELEDMAGRIGNLAQVEDIYHRSPGQATIDLGGYLQQLASKVVSASFGRNGRLAFDLQPIGIPTDRALPFGLLLTEILLRTQRQIPDTTEESEIRVSLHHGASPGAIVLSVTSAAPVPPAEVAAKTMGRRLLDALARQAEASLATEPAGAGSRIVVRFEVNAGQEPGR